MKIKTKNFTEVNQKLLERDPYLKKMVKALVDHYKPVQIYLFGSKAREDAGPNSDYDILVVVKETVSRAHKSLFQENRRKLGLTHATDVVVFTEKGFQERSTVVNTLPSTVIEEGALLYAA